MLSDFIILYAQQPACLPSYLPACQPAYGTVVKQRSETSIGALLSRPIKQKGFPSGPLAWYVLQYKPSPGIACVSGERISLYGTPGIRRYALTPTVHYRTTQELIFSAV